METVVATPPSVSAIDALRPLDVPLELTGVSTPSVTATPPPEVSGVPLAVCVTGNVMAGSAPVPMFRMSEYFPVLKSAFASALETFTYHVCPTAIPA